ncbi:unnamed protein product [Lupinus luteus]|uniref:Uncharacterized protein n=1 Tax=Lupinus luteus TaxID=3873 RepID=A0AAV1YQ43_LUPLU
MKQINEKGMGIVNKNEELGSRVLNLVALSRQLYICNLNQNFVQQEDDNGFIWKKMTEYSYEERGLDTTVTRGEEYDTKQGDNRSINKKS